MVQGTPALAPVPAGQKLPGGAVQLRGRKLPVGQAVPGGHREELERVGQKLPAEQGAQETALTAWLPVSAM